MPRRVVAILNPVSGRHNVIPVVRAVARLVEAGGGRLEIRETHGAGHATELASEVGSEVDALLVVGGDGTVCEVVNGLSLERPQSRPRRLREPTAPIVILAAGLENLLARELGMPTKPDDVARTLLHGQPFACDVGVINGRRFLAVAGIGFDAECIVRLGAVRKGHITHWDYFWPIWRTFWAYRFPTLRIEADGSCIFEGRGLALVGVIARYSAGMRILSQARYDDGLLDVCIFPCASRIKLGAHACRVFRRRHVGRGGVVYRQCSRVRITSPDEVPIEVDGELGGVLPADCTILPGAARFLGEKGDKFSC